MWQFYEGYGQTECTAGCSMSLPGDWTAGNASTRRQTHTRRQTFGEGMRSLNERAHKHKSAACLCASGHVGPPLPCNYVKLVDVAEMNYYAANGEGEVSHRCI